MKASSSEYLQAARRRLGSAQLLASTDPATCLSTAYYAALYAARAALSEQDVHARSHRGTWHEFRQRFVARAGVFMPAHPRVGTSFAQEHYAGHAEDHFRVERLHPSITVPFGSYHATALMTREWTPLEPGVRDGKWYIKGIGEIREAALTGPAERAQLVAFRR